jgi:cytochrome b561
MDSAIAEPSYSRIQILLHWTIAALVILQLLFGESMVTVVEAGEEGNVPPVFDQNMAWLHYWFGIAVLTLVVIRLGLRLTTGVPRVKAVGLTAWAATATHALFYLLLFVVPITGLLGYYYGDPWGELHTWGKPVFIVLIGLHVLGALYHQFWIKDGTLRRMLVPGTL